MSSLRRKTAHAAILVAAAALGGCTTGPINPAFESSDLAQDNVQAPWQVAGPTVAQRAHQADRQQCYGGASGSVDDCSPTSVRYDGP